ncbi:DNA-binding protein [Fusibacter sp. Q10-2]|uniref:DNA-binding protein n=2 Tax=Fusibacter ferrireducens TaxID=2785058 RepID=A0ABR9ZRR5_9FIRM|nr:DNA-binding protein [Fusibacter ferrireducens]
MAVGCSNKAQEVTQTDQLVASEEASTVQETDQDKESAEGRPVIRLAGSDTGIPNPFRHHTRGPGMSKMQILYDSLLESGADDYVPWLAKSWRIDESGLTYSFDLVNNAVWHDGEPLTVEDVIFTFDYYREHTPVLNNLIVNGTYIVESVEKTGDWTFDVKVNTHDNTYLSRLGGARILPKHIWQSVEDPIAYEAEDAAVGSGPYKMTYYDAVKGEYRYEAFDEYWGLKPAVEAIEWVPVSDSVLAFENEEIDLINIAPDLLARYSSDAKYTIQNLPSYHSYRLMMNMDAVDALKSVEVRKALAYGINRKSLIDKIARGAAEISSMGYVPSTSSWYNPNIEAYDYDMAKSKRLLEGKKLSFKLLTGNAPAEVKLAELIRIDLEAIGVEVTIESVESKTRDQAVKKGNYELLLINSGGMGGDPDYLRSIYGNASSNTAALNAATLKGYYNEEVSRLATAQATVKSGAERKEMIFEMQKLIAEDVPMIMLYSNDDNFVYRQEYYDGWFARFDHSKLDHNKLSYVVRE